MQKYVAVRLKSVHHGLTGFAIQEAKVINYNLEKRDPALKNIIDALLEQGLEYTVNGCGIFWFHIDDERDLAFYESLREVEFAFSTEWLDSKKASIRGYTGMEYVDACAAIAKELTIKDQSRDINYEVPSVA
ncbi:hypothetical protein R50073_30420 [Maricurvus nonylphenolicus]|uniref:hypothetical protein n=1 Tax=Maricurvus nonylphenolicus TaxID=1008307 RepID=UPI0036F38841